MLGTRIISECDAQMPLAGGPARSLAPCVENRLFEPAARGIYYVPCNPRERTAPSVGPGGRHRQGAGNSRANLRDVRPMLATSAARLPEGEQWSYEVKWDGYRTLAVKDGTRVTRSCQRCLVRAHHAVVAAPRRIGPRRIGGDHEDRPLRMRRLSRRRPPIQLLNHVGAAVEQVARRRGSGREVKVPVYGGIFATVDDRLPVEPA